MPQKVSKREKKKMEKMISSEKCLISIDLSKDKEVLEVKQLLEERDLNTYI